MQGFHGIGNQNGQINFKEKKLESAEALVDHLQQLVCQQRFVGMLSALD